MAYYGEPKTIRGACNARLMVGDNFGDNHVTFVCQLRPGHKGFHCESFDRGTMTWAVDERRECKTCGKLRPADEWERAQKAFECRECSCNRSMKAFMAKERAKKKKHKP